MMPLDMQPFHKVVRIRRRETAISSQALRFQDTCLTRGWQAHARCQTGGECRLTPGQTGVGYGCVATLMTAADWAVLSVPQRSQPWVPPPLQRALERGAVGSAQAIASAARTAPTTAMYLVVLRTWSPARG
jgi:hypothetical protein